MSLVCAAHIVTAISPATASVRLRSDVVYAVHGGVDLLLDAYLPADDRVHAAVVLIHGGRWAYGDKQDLAPLAFALVDEGYAAIAVNYRLLPDWPYPAAMQDVRAAVAYVRQHASELRIDPDRIGALGGSAGAYLAAALATFDEGPLTEGSRVAAAASWSGPLDLEALLPIEDSGIGATIAEFLGCVPSSCARLAHQASPVNEVDPGDAPLFIANATEERIPITQARSMARAYDRAGIPFELVTPESSGHGIRNEAELLEPTMHFFRKWLGTTAASQADDGSQPSGSTGSATQEAPPPGSGRSSANRPGGDAAGRPTVAILVSLSILLVGTTIAQLAVARRASRASRRDELG